MANGNGLSFLFPPAVLETLKMVGPTGVIAIFLVYSQTKNFERNLQQRISEHDRIEEAMARAHLVNERILWVLEQMCIKDAETPDERRRCVARGQP